MTIAQFTNIAIVVWPPYLVVTTNASVQHLMFFASLCVKIHHFNYTNKNTQNIRRTILCINLSACLMLPGSSSLSLTRRPNRPRRAFKNFCNVMVEQFVSHCICLNSSKILCTLVKSDSCFFGRTRFFFRGTRNIYTTHTDARPCQLIPSSPSPLPFQIVNNDLAPRGNFLF